MDVSQVEKGLRRELEYVLDEKELEIANNCDIKKYIRRLRRRKTTADKSQRQVLQGRVNSFLKPRLSARAQSSILDIPTDLPADSHSLPEGAEQILRDFCDPNKGLEIPQALEQLVEIFGPGSETVSANLLDNLAVDPSVRSGVNWDNAVAEAINNLNELKMAQISAKGKQRDKG
jgi:hypothetical protein